MFEYEILEYQKCMLTTRTLVWPSINVQVQSQLKVMLTLQQAMKAQRGSRVTAVLFL